MLLLETSLYIRKNQSTISSTAASFVFMISMRASRNQLKTFSIFRGNWRSRSVLWSAWNLTFDPPSHVSLEDDFAIDGYHQRLVEIWFEVQEWTGAELASECGVGSSSEVPARICPAFHVVNLHSVRLSRCTGMHVELLPYDGVLVSDVETLFAC